MRRLTIAAALALASMLVMSMAWAGSASAAFEPLWLLCLKSVGLTKYTNNQCHEASGEASSKEGWQSLGILPKQSDTIRIVSFTLVFRDSNAGPLKENSLVTCLLGGRGTGLINALGEAIIREAKVENAEKNCKSLAGPCSKITAVQGANLPWKQTLIEGPGEKTLGELTEDGKGEPGWEVTCTTLAGTRTDKCISEAGKPEKSILNNDLSETEGRHELLILGVFENEAKGSCSEGNAKNTAEIFGLYAILLWNGLGLSVHLSP